MLYLLLPSQALALFLLRSSSAAILRATARSSRKRSARSSVDELTCLLASLSRVDSDRPGPNSSSCSAPEADMSGLDGDAGGCCDQSVSKRRRRISQDILSKIDSLPPPPHPHQGLFHQQSRRGLVAVVAGPIFWGPRSSSCSAHVIQ